MIHKATTLIDEAIAAGVTPGAQLCVIHRGRCAHLSGHGVLARGGAAVTGEALYDVASVTKACATTLCAFVLLSRGQLFLHTEVRALLPAFREGITIFDLLAHGSGLPAWRPLFKKALADPLGRALFPGAGGPPPGASRREIFARARRLVVDAALGETPEGPPGRAVRYSDLGFILLGEALACAAGARLDRFFATAVAGPMGLPGLRFFDLASGPPDPGAPVAATGRTRPREPAPGQEGLFPIPPQAPLAIPGEVDDDNAYAMGGVAGHAGLFSTARDTAQLGGLLLEELAGAARLGQASQLASLLAPRQLPEGPARALGFDVPARTGSAAGRLLGQGKLGAFGHLGFTGCSLWVDRDRQLSVALFTSRVHETRARPEGILGLRQGVHDAVCLALEGAGNV